MIQPIPLTPILLHDGRELPVQARHSRLARRLAIRLLPGPSVELVLPPRGSLRRAEAFLAGRLDWVVRRAAAMPAAIVFAPGGSVPLLGTPHLLTHETTQGGAPFRIADGVINVAGDPRYFVRRTRDGLKRHAHQMLHAKTVSQAQLLSRAASRIAVGEMRTRWGSCSSRGRIGYSWRLILAPEWVLDYVVCHEVAHLVEMNHSASFWALVGQLCPGYRTAQAWLKAHGPGLLRYG